MNSLFKLMIKGIALLGIVGLLSSCGGGGGDSDSNSAATPDSIVVTVIGLRPVGLVESSLEIQFPDGSTQVVTENTSFTYDNTASNAKTDEVGIVSHPGIQACFARLDTSSTTDESATVNILCGYKNEIRVTGLEETQTSENALVITRDLLYYADPSLDVSPFAVLTITQNSTVFAPTFTGEPSAATYYSFLYGMPTEDVPTYEQDIRIIKEPNGYQCISFKGNLGFYQIACKKDQDPVIRYELAQSCVAIKASDSIGFITQDGAAIYKVDAVDISLAEKFFIKPARLGAFLLYDTGGGYFSKSGADIYRSLIVDSDREWQLLDEKVTVLDTGIPVFQTRQVLKPYGDDRRVNHNLTLQAQASIDIHQDESYQFPAESFEIIEVPSNECTPYPEASLNATVHPGFYLPKDPAQPAYGFADIHAHIGFPRTMGGMAMSGDITHPWGVQHALKDCADLHGTNGSNDLLASQIDGGAGHSTTGYPDLIDWPNRSAITHVQAYYRWIERAYLSGLRLAVTLATGNPSFCEALEQITSQKRHGCSGNASVEAQTAYIYEIQNYIDAQEGGPGKGWFRIVTSPQEAREVIAENKLAIVLGVEHGTLFSCREGWPCSNSYIDGKVNELYSWGVQAVFPAHRFDNAFAGTRLGGGSKTAWMNLSSKLSTSKIDELLDMTDITKYLIAPIEGHYYEIEECPVGTNGETDMYSMVDFQNNDLAVLTNLLPTLIGDFIEGKLSPFPDYTAFKNGAGNACNVRGLHLTGEHLVQRLMENGMFIDVGHMSQYAMEETLAMAEANGYPGLVSSHGWTDGTIQTHNRVFEAGGSIGIFNTTPQNFANNVANHRATITNTDYLMSFSLGSDIQGVTNQPGPDGLNNISYPFTSLDGYVTFEQPQTGNRVFDYETEGVAHYGLYAEWVESLRQVDAARGDDILGSFMNSAEAYIQMWERSKAHAAANQ